MIGTNKDETIVGISFLLALLTPHIGGLQIVNPILILFLAYKYSCRTSIVPIKTLICISLFASFAIYLLSGGTSSSNKEVLRVFYLIEMFAFFPFVNNTRITNKYLYIAIAILFASQLIFFLNISNLMRIINSYYPYDEDIMAVSERLTNYSTNKFAFRYGGMFNPNATSRYINLITIIALIENELDIKKIKLLIIIAIFGILLAGSRTGMLVFASTLILTYYLQMKSSQKHLIIIVTGIVICLLGSFVFYMQESDSAFRIFKVSDGLDDSIGTKISLLLKYIERQDSFVQILFGLFEYSSSYLSNNGYATDFEWGDIVMTYGFSLIFLLSIFYISCFRKMSRNNRLFYLILLWSISGTILMHYRMSFIFMFLLSKYYSRTVNYE